MSTHKSLIYWLAETYEQHRAERQAALAAQATPQPKPHSQVRRFLQWLTPNGGTLLLIAILILTQNVWARRTDAPSASSVTTIPYQGRLADINGDPVTGRINMEFRLYDTPTGGSPLWEEFWTGGNAVNVSDGLFSVMLGSINPSLVNVVQGNDELYLGITVGTDSEMEPRVQLGSVPFSVWSLTVADDSITADKIAPGAVGSDEIATGAVNQSKLAGDVPLWQLQSGVGSCDTTCDGWTLDSGSGVREFTIHIPFNSPFSTPPAVIIGLTHIDTNSTESQARVDIKAKNVTTSGFDLVLATWADTQVYGIEANWIAYAEP